MLLGVNCRCEISTKKKQKISLWKYCVHQKVIHQQFIYIHSPKETESTPTNRFYLVIVVVFYYNIFNNKIYKYGKIFDFQEFSHRFQMQNCLLFLDLSLKCISPAISEKSLLRPSSVMICLNISVVFMACEMHSWKTSSLLWRGAGFNLIPTHFRGCSKSKPQM